MAYCAQPDLERRLTLPILIELTDDTVPPVAVDMCRSKMAVKLNTTQRPTGRL